ncbi:MAG: hypothetical protein M3Q07_06375 [Pseudobdellovibrionaceae bacterium]|nr:hypothetical protein [Pseudobdellovibrionaceae bacterium]
MQKIIKLLTFLATINLLGCSQESPFSHLKDETGDVFTPIKDSDFDPIPAVNVEPYVDAVKDLCVESCYRVDNPEIDFSWSNSHLPGNTMVSEILGGSVITIATRESTEYNPAPQSANFKTPGASDSTKPSPDPVGKEIADMEIKARRQEMERRNQEVKVAVQARDKVEEQASQWISNFRETSGAVTEFETKARESLEANTAGSSNITLRDTYKNLAANIDKGMADRYQAQKRIEGSLPSVQIKPDANVRQFKTNPRSTEGLAVRRAESYVGYAMRSVNNAEFPLESRERAKHLLDEATETLKFADYKYASGQNAYGNKALEVTYALADMALAIAPIALVVAAPQTLILAIGVEAFNVTKNYYEYRTGKRLWDGAPLSPFQRDMALVNVGVSFMPAAFVGAAKIFTTAKAALSFTKEILAIGKTSEEVSSIAASIASAERITDSAQRAGITQSEMISELLEAAETTAKSPNLPLEKTVDDLLRTAEKGQARPQTPGRAERLSTFTDSQEERAIAEYLEDLGRMVEKNPMEGVPGAGRQGDAIVDGIVVEFKNVEVGGDSSTIRNSVRRSVEGTGQSRTILFDARGSGISESEAKRGIFRALGAYGPKLDYVSVIGDGFFVGYGPKPK